MGLKRLLEKEGQAQMHKLDAVSKNLERVKEKASQATGGWMVGKLMDQTRLLEESAGEPFPIIKEALRARTGLPGAGTELPNARGP